MPLPLESRFKTVAIGLDEAAKLSMTKTMVRVAIVATPRWRVSREHRDEPPSTCERASHEKRPPTRTRYTKSVFKLLHCP